MSLKSETQGFDISGKSAAVIGCGGLGCNVSVHLAGAGIGRLFLCDFDTVSQSNLNRQFLYSPADIGKSKAAAAAERLSTYAPDCEMIPVNKKIIAANDLDFAADCDIIILAADNAAARKTAYEFCRGCGKALINGGINAFFGSAYLCLPDKTPCLDCAGALAAGGGTTNVSSTAGVIGALCASLAERYLLGDSSLAGRLMIYDSEEITQLGIKPQSHCKCTKGGNKNE